MGTEQNSAKRKAIVIDDNRELCGLVAEFLTNLGFNVRQSHDGMQANNIVAEDAFDLIIVDYRLPSVSGLQVAAVARSSSKNRTSQIYMISGDVDPVLKTRCEGLKIRNIIAKPIDFPSLEASIKEHFAAKERKVSYDVRIINAFIEAAAEVYEFYFQEKPQRGKVIVKAQGSPEKGYCTGLSALTGNGFVGSLGLSLTAPFIKKLAAALFQGMDIKFDNDFVGDLTGEMCNQILGKVKLNFAKIGIPVTIGLPEVIMGKNHIIHHKVSNPVISIAMGRDNMVFELQFVLSQQNVKVEETKAADVPPSSVMMFE